ncbi:MAG: BatA domain-containing protein [Fluviicola sp.]|nr:BatA domain-containing protein [Fluviicola sp.]
MKFLYPQFLWALLVLIIPIVIHLFNFKRYKTLYFSSLFFVKHVDQKTKSTKSLKHLLVLLSRLLAFIFLVLAFAQPYFSNGDSSKQSSESLVSIYIDNSFSMQANGSEGELLSEARENARNIIEKASLDTRFLIATNDLSGSEERILTKIEAFEKIDKIKFSALTRTIDDVVQWQVNGYEKNQLTDNVSIQSVLLSDFQKLNGASVSKINGENITFLPIKLNAENKANIFIDSLWFSSPIHKINTKNELNIRIVNKGESDKVNTEVLISIGQFKKTIFVDIPNNQSITTKIGYMDKSMGTKTGKVQVVDNPVFFDDSYYLSYEVKKNINVLILDGEDAVPNSAMVLDLDNYFNYSSKKITAITKNDFEEKDFVIINGANEMTNGMTNYLTDFISTGGSVALFPGKNPNISGWNAFLQINELPLLGKRISTGTKIKNLNYDDPFFSGVFDSRTKKLNLPSVATVYQAIVTNQSMANSLIELQNGLPLFAKVQKNGSAYVFYSSLHEDFGAFAKDALFSTITLRMAELSQRKQPEYIVIGEDSRYPVYEKISKENPIHIVGEGVDFIPQTTAMSGINYISLKDANNIQQLKANNFELKTDKIIGAISLNYNRKESDLKTNNEEEIIAQLKNMGAENIEFNEIGGDSQLSTIDIQKPFSYWKIFIILTLIFVAIEMLLIRFLN